MFGCTNCLCLRGKVHVWGWYQERGNLPRKINDFTVLNLFVKIGPQKNGNPKTLEAQAFDATSIMIQSLLTRALLFDHVWHVIRSQWPLPHP